MELAPKQGVSILLPILSLSFILLGVGSYMATTKVSAENATAYYDNGIQDVNNVVRGKSFPVITASNQRIKLNESFNPKSWVKVTDVQDGVITSHVEVYGKIDNTKKGDYEIRYSVRNSLGLRSEKKIRVIVD